MDGQQDEIKKTIKNWLKETGMSRQELAEKCFVTYLTVKGWFAARGIIPPAKLAIIETLMHQEQEEAAAQQAEKSQWKICSTLVSQDEYKLIAAAAALDGMSIEEWCARELTRDAEERMQTAPATPALNYREKRDMRHITGVGHADLGTGA